MRADTQGRVYAGSNVGPQGKVHEEEYARESTLGKVRGAQGRGAQVREGEYAGTPGKVAGENTHRYAEGNSGYAEESSERIRRYTGGNTRGRRVRAGELGARAENESY